MDIVKTYTLNELGFLINFPFPNEHRMFIENALKSINLHSQKEIQANLDKALGDKLREYGYTDNEEKCSFWLPEFRKRVDLYHPDAGIAIEVEKAEIKRIVHDVLKLINGSLTFVPKIKYGVLVIPEHYFVNDRGAGADKSKSFESTARKDIKFYFGNIIPNKTNLQDILIVVYKSER